MTREICVGGNKRIGEDQPMYIIAEMSANHGGDFERAIEIVHAAKEAGADCIKVQTYTADTLTIDCDNSYFRIHKGNWAGETLHALYKRAYTPWEWQPRIKEEAQKLGLDFLSTPFDHTAVDFLEELGIDFYKVASFEMIDLPLVKYIASKGKPMIVSTGMASLEEIVETYEAVKMSGNEELCMLRCSSAYPAISRDMNLNIIPFLKEFLKIPIGLSDHSFGDTAAIAARALGASVLEKHLCLSREIETADSAFSMEPKEFGEMVKRIREAEKAMGEISFSRSEKEEQSMIFRRSLFIVKDIGEGELLTMENVRSIRPGNGLKPKHLGDVIGKRATSFIKRGTPLDWSMFK